MKQEPTAWINKERDVITFDNLFPEMTPLYEKREWVGLTDEDEIPWDGFDVKSFARAIETKLKELNT